MAGCSTCSTKSGNGTGCGCDSRRTVFDWLSDIPTDPLTSAFNTVEIRFKGGNKEFFKNELAEPIVTGEQVVVEASGGGWHLGTISLQGELVRLQMQRKEEQPEIRKILRKASIKDLERAQQAKAREMPTLFRTRQIINEHKLEMKLSDVEYQADNSKATFFYTAEGRIDFRELIKSLAKEFKIRVEMRQINHRQETGRVGGIGSCGRELCCSTWLNKFKSVNASAARYQNLALNINKLSGQCGRLKCCLNYELDTYLDAIKDIPEVNKPLQTEAGDAYLQKTDIFGKRMWFAYKGDSQLHLLTTQQVATYQVLNKEGKKAPALGENTDKQADKQAKTKNEPLNFELHMLDKKHSGENDKNKKRKRKRR